MRAERTACVLGGLLAFSLAAQAVDGIAPGVERPGERGPKLPDFLPEEQTPRVGAPPTSPAARPATPEGVPSFELRGVGFEGNTVFSDDDLKAVAKPFLRRRVTLADLEELRYRLTRHYTDQGYINSGVLLDPGQEIRDGRVVFQVLEGHLDEIRVAGTGRLRPEYVRDRVWPDPERPFNIQSLRERFQLLLRDPLIEQMDGQLQPGIRPGSAILDLEVTRARPWALSLNADNFRPPSTGAERVYLAGSARNLTGVGDVLDLAVGVSAGAREGSAAYSIPLTARDTRLWLRFDATNASVIEEPLEDLDIDSETRTRELGVTHPLVRSLWREISLGAVLSLGENRTSLLGEPFSFSSGADDGETRVTAVRLIQEFVDRTADQALALRSTVSFGIDAFDSTVHEDQRPDSEFVAWLGQAQYSRRLAKHGLQLLLRGDVQVAGDVLLDLERLAVGGARTVRGYRENELVRDNGWVVSAEVRYPVWKGQGTGLRESSLQLAAFTDYGAGWNEGEDSDSLHSVGLGLLWSYAPHYNAEVYVAHALKKAKPKQDYDLQDDGLHFRVNVNL